MIYERGAWRFCFVGLWRAMVDDIVPRPALQCSIGKRERMHKRTGAACISMRL